MGGTASMKHLLALAFLTCTSAHALDPRFQANVDECRAQMYAWKNCGPENTEIRPDGPPVVLCGVDPKLSRYFPSAQSRLCASIPRAAWTTIQQGGEDMCETVVKKALEANPNGAVGIASQIIYPNRRR